MKTRRDLYSGETEDILRSITMYHSIKREQLYKLYPNIKAEVLKKIIFHLINNRRVYYDKKAKIYYCSENQNTDYEMIKCLWVLCDFIENIEFHSTSDFPVNIIFFIDGETYDISYIPETKEAMFEQGFLHSKEHGKRIIILDNTEQLKRITIPDVKAYCTVNDDGKIEYYKLE